MASNLSILFRLISSYLLIIVVVLLSGIYTIWNLSEINRLIQAVTNENAREIQLSEESLEILYSATAAEGKFFVSRDGAYFRQFKTLGTDFDKRMTELASLAATQKKQELLARVRELHSHYGRLFDDTAGPTGARSVPEREIIRFRAERERIASEAAQRLRELARVASAERDERLVRIEAISVQTANAILVSLIVAVMMVIVISAFNTHSVSAPISRLREKTKAVARGDFGEPLNIVSPPEIRELADAFNTMCDRLRELDQMKIDYIGHLSHELRTPLTAIKEASSMLQEGLFATAPERERELQGLIRQECERLIRSVNRLLDFSMMESGMMPLSVQEAGLLPIVEKNLQRFSPLAQRKNIALQLEIPPELPRLRMDTEKIEMVLENLLSNALKFTPDGGRIIITARHRADAHCVEVAVSDTGRGIPESGLQEVFEKFRRVDDGKGAVRGTGLGLAIVKHIINTHGGHVWAESEFGKGSTFTFSLPA